MDYVTTLNDIHRLATERRDEFEVMRYMLELADEVSDEELDALVDAIAAPIIAAIDCKQCGNCCRSLDVYLTPDDAARLAEGVHIPLNTILMDVIDLERAQNVGEWGVFRQRPCQFLRGTLCSVYEHRPETCRTYPALTPDFRWTLQDTIEGAAICPIIYNVLDEMVKRAERL